MNARLAKPITGLITAIAVVFAGGAAGTAAASTNWCNSGDAIGPDDAEGSKSGDTEVIGYLGRNAVRKTAGGRLAFGEVVLSKMEQGDGIPDGERGRLFMYINEKSEKRHYVLIGESGKILRIGPYELTPGALRCRVAEPSPGAPGQRATVVEARYVVVASPADESRNAVVWLLASRAEADAEADSMRGERAAAAKVYRDVKVLGATLIGNVMDGDGGAPPVLATTDEAGKRTGDILIVGKLPRDDRKRLEGKGRYYLYADDRGATHSVEKDADGQLLSVDSRPFKAVTAE